MSSGNFDFSSASHGAQVSGSFEDINKLIFIEQHMSLDAGAVRSVKDDSGRLTPTFHGSKYNKSAPIGIPNSSSTSNAAVPLSPLSHAIHGFHSFVEPNSNRGAIGGSASKVFPLLAESPSNSNHNASHSFLQNNFQFSLGTSPGVPSSVYPPSSTWFGYNNSNNSSNGHNSSSPPVNGNGVNAASLSHPVTNVNSSTSSNPNNGTNPNAHPFPFHPQQQPQPGPLGFRQQNSPHSPASLQRSLSSDSINQYSQPQNVGGGVWTGGNCGGMHKSYSDYQYDNSSGNGSYHVSDNNNNNNNNSSSNSNSNNNNNRNNNHNHSNNNDHNGSKQQHGNMNQNVGKQNLPRGANTSSRQQQQQQQSGQNRAGINASNNFNSNRERNSGSSGTTYNRMGVDFGSPDGSSNINNNGNASGNNSGHGQGFQRVSSNNNLHHDHGNNNSNNNRQQGLQGMSRNRTNLSSEKLSNFKNGNGNNNSNNNSNKSSDRSERGDNGNSASKGSPALVPPLCEEELAALEKKVIRTCKEILREASARNLKAVELANTLRARVGTSVLAQVREQCQGLLTLLEKQTGVFRVDRIPKNDMVTLISDFEDVDDVFANLDDKGSSSGRSLSNDHYLASHMANLYSPGLLNKGLNVSGDPGATSSASPWYVASALNQSSVTTSSSSSSGGEQPLPSPHIQSFFLFSSEPSESIVIENPNFCAPQNLVSELEQYGQVMLLKKCQMDGNMYFFITYDTLESASVAKFSVSRLMNRADSVNFATLNDVAAPQTKRRVSSGSGSALFSLKEDDMRGFDLLASSMMSGNRRYSGHSDTVNSEYTDVSDISERISISESDPAFDLIDYGKLPGARSLSHDGYMTSIFSTIHHSTNPIGNLSINNNSNNNSSSSSNYISPLRGLHTSLSANSLYSMVSNTSSTHSTHTTSGTTGSVGGAASNVPYAASLTMNLSPPFQIPAICGTPMCHVLQRLCDDTYVPTQLWPVDVNNDAFYFQAVIVQLQNFGGQTSISKLRGFLRNRVNAVDNIKSVPLKALLSAYPQLFILRNSQVSLTQYAINCYGGLSISSNNGSNVNNSAGFDPSQFVSRQDSSGGPSNGGGGNNNNSGFGLNNSYGGNNGLQQSSGNHGHGKSHKNSGGYRG